MKKHLFVLLLATCALAGFAWAQTAPAPAATVKPGQSADTAAIEAQIIALEKGTWEAVKRHDAKAFAAVCLDDCVEIWGDGSVLTIKEVLDQVPDTVISEYKMEDVTVSVLNQHTALIRYKIWARTSFKGQETPPQWMLASAVWVKKGDAWKAAFYQETPAPKK
jgi:hypothetical protein